MNRIALVIGILLGCVTSATADHITGGEVYYKFVGTNGGLYDYDVTVRIFMRCNSTESAKEKPVCDRTWRRPTDCW